MEESTSSNQNDVAEYWSDSSDDSPFLDCASPPKTLRRRRRSVPHGSTREVSILGNYRKFKERAKIELPRTLMANDLDGLGSVKLNPTANEDDQDCFLMIINENQMIIDGNLEGLASDKVGGSGFEGVNEEKRDLVVVTNENEDKVDGDLELKGTSSEGLNQENENKVDGNSEVKGRGFKGLQNEGNEEKEGCSMIKNENEEVSDGNSELKGRGFKGLKNEGNDEKEGCSTIKNENEEVSDGNWEGLGSFRVRGSGFKGVNEEKEDLSVVTVENGEESRSVQGMGSNDLEGNDRLEGSGLDSRGDEDLNTSILLFFVNLLIKSITFQINLLTYVVVSPLWLVYRSYMFLIDPFGIMRRGRSYVVGKLIRMLGVFSKSLSPVMHQWLKEHDSVWRMGMAFGWGILWSAYAGIILVGLFLLAFVMGGLVIKGIVKEPLRIKENLNFDYTVKSPVAYVPLAVHPMGEHTVEYNENMEEIVNVVGERRIAPNRKLQITVSLKLPESDYNRNLGIFQVRVDLLTADGKILASSRRPCMLQFKSDIIRHALTFLNAAPLITGYSSESQTINVNFRGFTEGSRPTAGLRVIVEQRAEFHPGGGIPEIYSASLDLESELPLLKRIMWYWRKTLFVWISMTVFTVELFFALLCCRPLVIPRVKLRENSARHNAPGFNPQVQR